MVDPTTRDLIRRMADELDHYRQLLTDDRRETHALATEARALLAAEPQGDVLTDDAKRSIKEAAEQARQTLEGWTNYGNWVWPESALEQAKRNTAEALASLNAALTTEPRGEGPTDEELEELFDHLEETEDCPNWHTVARAALARWGRSVAPPAEGEVGR